MNTWFSFPLQITLKAEEEATLQIREWVPTFVCLISLNCVFRLQLIESSHSLDNTGLFCVWCNVLGLLLETVSRQPGKMFDLSGAVQKVPEYCWSLVRKWNKSTVADYPWCISPTAAPLTGDYSEAKLIPVSMATTTNCLRDETLWKSKLFWSNSVARVTVGVVTRGGAHSQIMGACVCLCGCVSVWLCVLESKGQPHMKNLIICTERNSVFFTKQEGGRGGEEIYIQPNWNQNPVSGHCWNGQRATELSQTSHFHGTS